jgi:hypothetical protein
LKSLDRGGLKLQNQTTLTTLIPSLKHDEIEKPEMKRGIEMRKGKGGEEMERRDLGEIERWQNRV